MSSQEFLILISMLVAGLLIIFIIIYKPRTKLLKGIYYIVAFYSATLIILVAINFASFISGTSDQTIPNYWIKTSLIDILTAGSTMALGAISLFLAQNQFSEKRKEEISEDIASPLFLEIKDIKEKFLEDFRLTIDINFGGYSSVWKSFKNTHKQVIASDISLKIPQFYTACNEYCNGLHKIQLDALPIINTEFNKFLQSLGDYIIRSELKDAFKLQFNDKYGVEKEIHLLKSLIFNKNIIEYLDAVYDDFKKEKIKFIIEDYRYGRMIIQTNPDDYLTYGKTIETYLDKREEVIKIRQERKQLISIAEEIQTILKNHIESIGNINDNE